MKFRQRFPPDEPPEAPLTSWALYDGFWPILLKKSDFQFD